MPNSQRQALRLPNPAVQLKLPFLLLIVTLLFGALMALHTHVAYDRMVEATLSSVPKSFEADVRAQTADYLTASASMLAGYALLVVVLCVGYTHGLIGPTVALKRQARKLRDGDFTARTQLRQGNTVFAELAGDLNAVAEMLEQEAVSRGAAAWRA